MSIVDSSSLSVSDLLLYDRQYDKILVGVNDNNDLQLKADSVAIFSTHSVTMLKHFS